MYNYEKNPRKFKFLWYNPKFPQLNFFLCNFRPAQCILQKKGGGCDVVVVGGGGCGVGGGGGGGCRVLVVM